MTLYEAFSLFLYWICLILLHIKLCMRSAVMISFYFDAYCSEHHKKRLAESLHLILVGILSATWPVITGHKVIKVLERMFTWRMVNISRGDLHIMFEVNYWVQMSPLKGELCKCWLVSLCFAMLIVAQCSYALIAEYRYLSLLSHIILYFWPDCFMYTMLKNSPMVPLDSKMKGVEIPKFVWTLPRAWVTVSCVSFQLIGSVLALWLC